MNCSLKQAAALAVCLCLVYQQSAQAQLFTRAQTTAKVPAQTKKNAVVKKDSSVKQAIAAMEKLEKRDSSTKQVDYTAGYDTFDASEFGAGTYYESGNSCNSCEMCFDGCCDSGCCGGHGLCGRPGQFFAYGEYIYVRPSFSEALAYVVSDNNNPLTGQQFVEFDFDYTSSYRFGGGYRFCDCGGEIVFNYARYRGEAEFAVEGEDGLTILGPYEVNVPTNGGFLFGEADVDVRSYDLGVAKTIPLGSPLGCCNTCCDTCCDPCCTDPCCGDCCCGWCPAWDITWSAGVRFAEVDWSRNANSFEPDLDPVRSSLTRLNFEGVGARIGLLGRRYFGRRGCVSMYARGDISLLVGDMDISTQVTDFSGSGEDLIVLTQTVHSNTGRRVIPVTEIEAGVTAHLGKHVNLSSGYLLSAWHDLGFRDEYGFGGAFELLSYDDANILGFDGFFARAEVAY